ncbi:MAG: NAD(P)-binding protein, partial [Smithellaceae bacterium]
MKEKNSIFMVVGAGLTGAVIARSLADGGYRCVVIEKSDHVAGNCHTMRDLATGILMHCYGPHTLHSDNNEVWDFVSRFAEIRPYVHRKQAWVNNVLYPFPVNLTALKMFFGKQLDEARAAELLAGKARPYATRRP